MKKLKKFVKILPVMVASLFCVLSLSINNNVAAESADATDERMQNSETRAGDAPVEETSSPTTKPSGDCETSEVCTDKPADDTYNVPILGQISAKSVSLPILAIVLGLTDGFNPCAMWVLIFLITMLFGMKDRKKMWVLGITFLASSALVYVLFMVSWLSLATFLSSIKIIRLTIAVFAIIFGMVNIYRYIKSKDEANGCDVTDRKKRSKIMEKIKKIVTEKSFLLAMLGIIALAASVNIIELLCSLGLPVIFTNVLSMNNLSIIEYIIYIFIYILFFMLDDIIVFVVAMKTMEIKGISTKIGKCSHLIGGIIMLVLGILMAVKPEWIMFNF